jgi:hypothetical protein
MKVNKVFHVHKGATECNKLEGNEKEKDNSNPVLREIENDNK